MSNVKFGAEAWNARFSGEDYAYGKEPNEWLKVRIKPGSGKALVPADGEGRNAVYIASLGYETDVFDLSDVGKEKCKKLADEKGVSVNYEVDDLVTRDFTAGKYDLMAFSWFHVPWDIFIEQMISYYYDPLYNKSLNQNYRIDFKIQSNKNTFKENINFIFDKIKSLKDKL